MGSPIRLKICWRIWVWRTTGSAHTGRLISRLVLSAVVASCLLGIAVAKDRPHERSVDFVTYTDVAGSSIGSGAPASDRSGAIVRTDHGRTYYVSVDAIRRHIPNSEAPTTVVVSQPPSAEDHLVAAASALGAIATFGCFVVSAVSLLRDRRRTGETDRLLAELEHKNEELARLQRCVPSPTASRPLRAHR